MGPMRIATMAVFGGACAGLASSRGRSPLAWFALGCLLSVFGIVLLLVLPDLAAERERTRRLEQENRFLRERLARQDEAAEQHAGAPSAAVDASPAADVGARALVHDAFPVAPAGAALDPARPARERERDWYYACRDEPRGPVAFAELERLWRCGDIGRATLVWRAGMVAWSPLGELPELDAALRA